MTAPTACSLDLWLSPLKVYSETTFTAPELNTAVIYTMAPTAEQLLKSNVRVEKRPGVTQRIFPVNRLYGFIKRFLPPPGSYFDQSTVNKASEAIKADEKCIFCWHQKDGDKDCKCEKKCVLCKSNGHPGGQCSKVYVGIKWWRARGHRLRNQFPLRPNPAERAYLVVAGVFKDWKQIEERVIDNMKHPFVKDFYRGKKAPSTGTNLPKALRSSSVTTAIGSSATLSTSDPDADEANPITDDNLDASTARY